MWRCKLDLGRAADGSGSILMISITVGSGKFHVTCWAEFVQFFYLPLHCLYITEIWFRYLTFQCIYCKICKRDLSVTSANSDKRGIAPCMVLFCKGIVLRVWGKYWSILPGRHLLFMIGFHVGRQVSMDHLQKCTGIGNFHNACTWSKSGKPSIEKERLFSLITANIITSKVSNSAFCLLLDCIWMHCIHCILYKVHCIQMHCI